MLFHEPLKSNQSKHLALCLQFKVCIELYIECCISKLGGGAQVEPKERNVVVWVKQKRVKNFVLQVHLKSFQHFSYSLTLQQQSSQ